MTADRQLTRTGGLPFAGGPWNHYVMHAIATVVQDLRRQPDEKGLVWANGGYESETYLRVAHEGGPLNPEPFLVIPVAALAPPA